MRSPRFSIGLCAALTAASASFSAPALAQGQPPLALNRFDPAPAGDRMFGVQSPFVAGELTPHVMLLGDYAHNPLVLRRISDEKIVGAVVSSQLYLHLNASLALFHRLNVNVDVPVALVQAGDDPSANGVRLTSPSNAQFGDLRAGLRLRLLGDYHDVFQVAVGGYVWFPTGPATGYVGNGKVRGMPQLIVGGRSDRLVWSIAGGPQFQSSAEFVGVSQGTQIKWGGGVGVLLGDSRRLQVGPEISMALTLDDVKKSTTNAEVLVDARYRIFDDLEVGIGAGPGVSGGVGTPDFRAVAMLSYSPKQKVTHRPVPLRVDSDKDGLVDAVDACPNVAGAASQERERNGCPKSVRVTDEEIIIVQQVQFNSGRTTIKQDSYALLDEVARVFKDHPEIARVEIQGHTDNTGNAKENLKLSEDRAESVKKALVKRGIDKARLSAKGFGQDVPIADNKTEAGRQKNRRVEFKILEKTPRK
jgi:outer membrane protein OmpA-like peptidoglycan-associated protein